MQKNKEMRNTKPASISGEKKKKKAKKNKESCNKLKSKASRPNCTTKKVKYKEDAIKIASKKAPAKKTYQQFLSTRERTQIEPEHCVKSDFEDYPLKNNKITYLISGKMLEKVKILSLGSARTIIKHFGLKSNLEVKTTS